MYNLEYNIEPTMSVAKYLVTRIFVYKNVKPSSTDKYTIFHDLTNPRTGVTLNVIVFNDTYFEIYLKNHIISETNKGYNIAIDKLPSKVKEVYCQPHKVVFALPVYRRLKNKGCSSRVILSDLEKNADGTLKEYYTFTINCLLYYDSDFKKVEFSREHSPEFLAQRIFEYEYVSQDIIDTLKENEIKN